MEAVDLCFDWFSYPGYLKQYLTSVVSELRMAVQTSPYKYYRDRTRERKSSPRHGPELEILICQST